MSDEKIIMLVQHIDKLLNAPVAPDFPKELVGVEKVFSIHESMLAIRDILYGFSNGDLSSVIKIRGFQAGCLKTMQANLRHLTWQAQQVRDGDFSQKMEFMGEFASAFNSMVEQLSSTILELQKKEEALLQFSKKQQQEVELRKIAMRALRQSEAKFKHLADHDSFTECFNRRAFFSLAENSLKKASLAGEPCCIALIDIDSFKLINDTYGHLNGDLALHHIVKVANAQLRKFDLIGRYGGEEFILFFYGVGLDQGIVAAERIRAAIADSPIKLPSGDTLVVTVSIGVSAVLPYWPGNRNAHYLMQITDQADKALYRAKTEGKNCVCAANLTPPLLNVPDE